MKRQKTCGIILSMGLLVGVPMSAMGEPVQVGAEAPPVVAKDETGKEVDLAKLYAEGTTLVYFYPKADTPGCTKQACSLRDAYKSLEEKGIRVVGVSMDSVEDQKAFKEKHKLPFTLLADADGAVVKAFGVPEMRPGFASRQAFLIREGKVVWRDLTASTDEQAKDVLAALEELE